MEKRIGGWQCWVEIKKDYVIKTIKTRQEMRETIGRYLKSIGKMERLEESVQKMTDDIKESTKIIKNSNIPNELLAYPQFMKNGTVKQKKAMVLKEIINENTPKSKIKQAKKLIDKAIDLMLELWKYGIHEKTFKFTSNIGILNNKGVLIDLFELTDNKSKVEKQLSNLPWNKPKRLKAGNSVRLLYQKMPKELADYFIRQANKKLTRKNLDKYWKSKS